MCRDPDFEKNETNRVLLQISYERNNQLSNMLIALNGFILAFIAGIITFVGSTFFSSPCCITIINSQVIPCNFYNSDKTIPSIIAINVLVIVLILWRIYSHYIDNQIVMGYQKIFRCEYLLPIDEKLKLLNIFEKDDGVLKLNKINSYKERLVNKNDEQQFAEKINVIEQLTQCKKMGYRGHYWFNVITIFVITVLLITEATLLKFVTEDKIILFIFGILGLLLIVVICFYFDLRHHLTFFSHNIKNHFNGYLIRIFFLACSAITLIFLFSLNGEFFKNIMWTVLLFATKDICIFLVLAYLVFCFAHKDPTEGDIDRTRKDM